MSWRKSDFDREQKKRHEVILGKLDRARQTHLNWVSQRYANSREVLREARYEVDAYEEEHGIEHGTLEVVFDDHGAHLGYFLVVPEGVLDEEHDLVARLRRRTGEAFVVDHRLG
jgi:hypothetical protein